jgi:thiol-disulfide isomerase/thioredoxin
MLCTRIVLTALSVVFALAMGLHANVQVGEDIAFSYETLDGKKVSTEDLKGRMIIVEHWATWCPPCVAQVPHLKKLHADYGPRGMVLIGISHDRGTSEVERFIKDKDMTWPQVMQSSIRGGPAWGVRGIPHAFIISPEGKLLWRGHPAGLDAPLEQAMKDHPPVLRAPSASGNANESIRAANSAIDRKDYGSLLDAVEGLPEAAFEDRAAKARLTGLGRRLTSPAVEAEPLQLAGAERADAMAKLMRIAGLSSPDGVEPTLGGAGRGEARTVAPAVVKVRMERADAAREKEEHVEAYKLYKWVADRAADDEHQPIAAEYVRGYETDEAFMAQWKQAESAEAARALLATARSYAEAGKKELAIETYEKVVADHAGTAEARQAQDALARLRR